MPSLCMAFLALEVAVVLDKFFSVLWLAVLQSYPMQGSVFCIATSWYLWVLEQQDRAMH